MLFKSFCSGWGSNFLERVGVRPGRSQAGKEGGFSLAAPPGRFREVRDGAAASVGKEGLTLGGPLKPASTLVWSCREERQVVAGCGPEVLMGGCQHAIVVDTPGGGW